MTPEPTVFVVDDDEAVRRFLRGLIASIGLRVEIYGSAQMFLDAYEPGTPGCLLLDLRMPNMSGLELQKKLAERAIDLPVIIVTGHGDVQVAVHAMKNGAFDFVEKPFNNELLLDSIQKAVADSERSTNLRVEREAFNSRIELLTPRERQVLEIVVTGETNKGVARYLDISDKTVEIHRAHVMEKMQAKSLAHLVKMIALFQAD